MYSVELDEAARKELVRRTRLPNLATRTRDRLEMVRLSDAGWSVPQIARHFGMHHQTVRFWIRSFLTGEFDALSDRPRTGRPSGVSDEILAEVERLLTNGDRTWSARQVAEWVSSHHGVTRSAKQWRRILKRRRQSFKRTGRSLRHKQDPEAVQAAKKERASHEEAQKGAAKCSTPATLTRQEWR